MADPRMLKPEALTPREREDLIIAIQNGTEVEHVEYLIGKRFRLLGIDLSSTAAPDRTFRREVRSILIDRASLDEQIEEFFDEVLDDIETAHLRYRPGSTEAAS